jgi:phosphoribosyl 1,2-cyclic phosphate phosphodiesterase
VDLRQQALREKIPRIDAVLYTHPHADHLNGIDELRAYNFIQREAIPLFGNAWTCEHLKQSFGYVFAPARTPEGGGVPKLVLNQIEGTQPQLDVAGISVIPLSLKHGPRDETLGFRIDSVAYVTDCSYIPETTLERMKGLSLLVLDCLRLEPHGTHFNLDQALETVSRLCPKKTFLTHLGHEMDYAKWKTKLPPGVHLAFDGLKMSASPGRLAKTNKRGLS